MPAGPAPRPLWAYVLLQRGALGIEGQVDQDVIVEVDVTVAVEVAVAPTAAVIVEAAVGSDVVVEVDLPVEIRVTVVGVLHEYRCGVGCLADESAAVDGGVVAGFHHA